MGARRISNEESSVRMFALRNRGTRNFLLVLCIMYFILYVDRVNLAAAAGRPA